MQTFRSKLCDDSSSELAIQQIQSLNLTRVINKLVNVAGWLKDDAETTAKLYQNYLILLKRYRNEYSNLPPSEDIDEFWHNHILDTEAYIEDCKKIFGRYLHHNPFDGSGDKTEQENFHKAFEITQALHLQEFGKYIEATRSKYPKFIYYLLKKFEIIFTS